MATLGLGGPSLLTDSREVLAAAIRRAASFLCPCSAKSLTNAVTQPLRHIVQEDDNLQDVVEDVLEELLAIGDLQEYRNVGFNRTALLYLAPPSYVCLSGGTIVLLGVAPDNISVLPEDLEQKISYKGCLRYLKKEPPHVDSPVGKSLIDKAVGEQAEIAGPSGKRVLTIVGVSSQTGEENDEELISCLSQFGLVRYSEENWLKAPPDETASQYISRFDRILEHAAPSGDIPGIMILNSGKSVRYYRGRWSSPKNLSGRYIGRRRQAYGNDIWCYLEVEGGRPKKFLDLPLTSSTGLRGCDEAWRIQTALDAQCGKPQQYRLRKMTDKTFAVDVFSPIPSWIERRWNWVGKRIENRGSLLSFQFAETDIKQELDFIRRKLWLVESIE
ncbi:MAG: hypothetical protein DDT32_00147 [Syntrophomonadaceae bacterium]|nr:hypothetical protein [Bacillota bacterium]MBT9146421.1 hypothetical protein [Bacillota bacterium]